MPMPKISGYSVCVSIVSEKALYHMKIAIFIAVKIAVLMHWRVKEMLLAVMFQWPSTS